MQQIHLYLKNNEEVYFDDNIDTLIKNNIIKFSINNYLYSIDLRNNVIIRKDKEISTKIDINKKCIIMNIYKEDYHLNIPIKIDKFVNKKDEFILQYKIEDTNEVTMRLNLY